MPKVWNIRVIFPNFQNRACCEKLFAGEQTQQPPFDAKICSDICRSTLSVPQSSHFTSNYDLEKLVASLKK